MSASREKRSRKNVSAAEPDKTSKKVVKKTGKFSDRFYSIIAVTIAAVLVISVGFAIFQNVVFTGKNFAAADVGEDKIYPHEVNFYYVNSYLNYVNTYGSYLQFLGLDTTKPLKAQKQAEDTTWHDFFLKTALNSVQEVKMLYKEALAAGVTLNDTFTKQIETDVSSLESSVKGQNSTLDAYLESYYGSAMTRDEYKRILSESYLAQQYGQQVFDGYTYSDEEVKNFYNENKKDFDVVDYRSFFFATAASQDATEEEIATAKTNAKSLADIMEAAITDEESFIRLSKQNASEDEKDEYEDASITLKEGVTYSSLSNNTKMADWLFDTARANGDTKVFESDAGYTVVFMKARYRNDYNTANVRHILIQYDLTEDQTEATPEQIEAAKIEAQAILDEWSTGDKTEERFAELAKERSEDTGSAANGGLYEDVYKGQMVASFEDWTFNPARKAGDTGLVETEYGYHVMYYVSSGSPYWTIQVDSKLRNDDYTKFNESLKTKYPLKSKTIGMMAVGLPK